MGTSPTRPSQSVSERWNEVFKVLSIEPRRQLTLSLMNTSYGESVVLPQAAHSENFDGSFRDLGIDLQHNHLPQMKQLGFIDYSSSPFQAMHGPRFNELSRVLDPILSSAHTLPDELVHGCEVLEG